MWISQISVNGFFHPQISGIEHFLSLPLIINHRVKNRNPLQASIIMLLLTTAMSLYLGYLCVVEAIAAPNQFYLLDKYLKIKSFILFFRHVNCSIFDFLAVLSIRGYILKKTCIIVPLCLVLYTTTWLCIKYKGRFAVGQSGFIILIIVNQN